MPRLVSFLLFHAGVGFALALLSVVAILGLNIGGLSDLIMTSSVKWIALLALVVLMTITLASVQMGAAIMCLPYDREERDDDPGSNSRARSDMQEFSPVPRRVNDPPDRPLHRHR